MESPDPDRSQGDSARDFIAHSETKASHPGLAAELIAFLKYNKKWWLLPIIVVLLLIGVLVMLGGSALAPMIYTLF